MSATALGTGAVIVVAAGLGVSIARTGDEGAVRSSADSAPTTPTASVSTHPTPTVIPSRSSSPAPTRSDRHHSDVPGAGRSGGHSGAGHSGAGTHRNRQPAPGPTDLPYTGSPPVPATTALGLLLAAAGSWTLVRVPGGPRRVSVTAGSGAIDRLRAPRATR